MTPAPSGTCYITYVSADTRSTTSEHRLKLHFADEKGAHSVLIRPDAVGMATLVKILQERQRTPSPKIGTSAAPTQHMLEAFGAALSRDIDERVAAKRAKAQAEADEAMAFLSALGIGD